MRNLNWKRVIAVVVIPSVVLMTMVGFVFNYAASNKSFEYGYTDRTKIVNNMSNTSLDVLAKLLADYETDEEKLAIANIVLNASEDSGYSIEEIILTTSYNFESAKDLSILGVKPSNNDYAVAKTAIKGANNIGESLYFIDTNNYRKSFYHYNVYEIGGYVFYSSEV